MTLSRNHAEVVDGDPGIDGTGDFAGFVLQTHEIFVFGIDRVHMDHGFAVQFPGQIHLDIIDAVVDIKHILECGHFRVERNHLTARTVVMDDYIVESADTLVRKNDLRDLIQKLFGWRGAEKRFDGLPCGIDSGIEYEDGQCDTDIGIDRKIRKLRGDHGEENNGCRDHIIPAVDGSSFHGGRIDDLGPVEVVVHHVCFYEQRSQKDGDRGKRAVHRRRMDDALDGRLAEFEAHDADQERNDEARDILDTAMSERMVRVRCFAREAESDHGDNGRSCIGKVIQRITDDGDGVGEDTHDQFSEKQENIEEDPAGTADLTDFPSDMRLLGLLIVRYQFSNQK